MYQPTITELSSALSAELRQRRQLRLQQVRDQARLGARRTRQRGQAEWALQRQQLKHQLTSEWAADKENKLCILESEYSSCLRHVGSAHRAANHLNSRQLKLEDKLLREKRCQSERERHRAAAATLKQQVEDSRLQLVKQREHRKGVSERERQRAQRASQLGRRLLLEKQQQQEKEDASASRSSATYVTQLTAFRQPISLRHAEGVAHGSCEFTSSEHLLVASSSGAIHVPFYQTRIPHDQCHVSRDLSPTSGGGRGYDARAVAAAHTAYARTHEVSAADRSRKFQLEAAERGRQAATEESERRQWDRVLAELNHVEKVERRRAVVEMAKVGMDGGLEEEARRCQGAVPLDDSDGVAIDLCPTSDEPDRLDQVSVRSQFVRRTDSLPADGTVSSSESAVAEDSLIELRRARKQRLTIVRQARHPTEREYSDASMAEQPKHLPPLPPRAKHLESGATGGRGPPVRQMSETDKSLHRQKSGVFQRQADGKDVSNGEVSTLHSSSLSRSGSSLQSRLLSEFDRSHVSSSLRSDDFSDVRSREVSSLASQELSGVSDARSREPPSLRSEDLSHVRSREVSSLVSQELSGVSDARSREPSSLRSEDLSHVRSWDVSSLGSHELSGVSDVRSREPSSVRSHDFSGSRSIEPSSLRSQDLSDLKSRDVSSIRSPNLSYSKSRELLGSRTSGLHYPISKTETMLSQRDSSYPHPSTLSGARVSEVVEALRREDQESHQSPRADQDTSPLRSSELSSTIPSQLSSIRSSDFSSSLAINNRSSRTSRSSSSSLFSALSSEGRAVTVDSGVTQYRRLPGESRTPSMFSPRSPPYENSLSFVTSPPQLPVIPVNGPGTRVTDTSETLSLLHDSHLSSVEYESSQGQRSRPEVTRLAGDCDNTDDSTGISSMQDSQLSSLHAAETVDNRLASEVSQVSLLSEPWSERSSHQIEPLDSRLQHVLAQLSGLQHRRVRLLSQLPEQLQLSSSLAAADANYDEVSGQAINQLVTNRVLKNTPLVSESAMSLQTGAAALLPSSQNLARQRGSSGAPSSTSLSRLQSQSSAPVPTSETPAPNPTSSEHPAAASGIDSWRNYESSTFHLLTAETTLTPGETPSPGHTLTPTHTPSQGDNLSPDHTPSPGQVATRPPIQPRNTTASSTPHSSPPRYMASSLEGQSIPSRQGMTSSLEGQNSPARQGMSSSLEGQSFSARQGMTSSLEGPNFPANHSSTSSGASRHLVSGSPNSSVDTDKFELGLTRATLLQSTPLRPAARRVTQEVTVSESDSA